MYRAIARNKRNTVFTILLFLLIIGGLGWLAAYIYGNLTIVIVTLVIAIGYALIQYFTADKQAIALSGAVEIRSKAEHPRLWRTVEPLDRDRHPHAEGVRHLGSGAQRVRDGEGPAARGRRRHHRASRAHGRRGARGRHGA